MHGTILSGDPTPTQTQIPTGLVRVVSTNQIEQLQSTVSATLLPALTVLTAGPRQYWFLCAPAPVARTLSGRVLLHSST